MARHVSIDGEGDVWVTKPKGSIKKDNLTFMAMFLRLIVRQCVFPTAVDNIVRWCRPILMATILVGFEVDFTWLLHAIMHDSSFKAQLLTHLHA